jgi:hypothetical protein
MNPERILCALDHHLVKPVHLILYGRAALALGFPPPRPEFAMTLDVDVILPEVEITSIEQDSQFWDALEAANAELESDGLYLTHLFLDSQIILSRDWLERLVPIEFPDAGCLRLSRPSAADLLLTKMMRVDPQDREDMLFLLRRSDLSEASVDSAIESAVVPDISEIREAFETNAAWLREQIPLL